MESHKVSITLRGKTYAISTGENQEHVVEAAQALDLMMTNLEQAENMRRDDHLAMFSALQALVAVIKERDSYKKALAGHIDRLSPVLEDE